MFRIYKNFIFCIHGTALVAMLLAYKKINISYIGINKMVQRLSCSYQKVLEI